MTDCSMQDIAALIDTLKEDKPDFLSKHSTFVLTLVGLLSAFFGGVLSFFLRSRCSRIQMGCFSCERQPVELDASQTEVVTTQAADE